MYGLKTKSYSEVAKQGWQKEETEVPKTSLDLGEFTQGENEFKEDN